MILVSQGPLEAHLRPVRDVARGVREGIVLYRIEAKLFTPTHFEVGRSICIVQGASHVRFRDS